MNALTVRGDRVLVKTERQGEYTSESGLYVADDEAREVIGTVVAIGDVSAVKPSDVVIFSPVSGQEMRYEGESYLVLREDDILAIWE